MCFSPAKKHMTLLETEFEEIPTQFWKKFIFISFPQLISQPHGRLGHTKSSSFGINQGKID
jgi:hypothetical protein